MPASIAEDAFLGNSVDDGADAGAEVLGRAQLQAARRLHEPVEKRLIDRLQHDGARTGRALLTLIAERAGRHPLHRLVKVGVVVNDDGVLAAHLGDEPFDVILAGGLLGGLAMEQHAHALRAGEGDEGRVGMFARVGPISSPTPGRKLTTPAGRPISRKTSMNWAPITADCSAGFMTTVLPVTSAAVVMPHRMARGSSTGR